MDGNATQSTDDQRAEWLEACRRASAGIRTMLAGSVGVQTRATETGTRGSGGDRTLVIDRDAESIVFEQLERLHDAGHRFRAVSEERGEVDFGAGEVVVVVDPIDGSLNAKRGLAHHALSVAVAHGQTMADVRLGYVYDFGTGEEWWAQRGEGAFLNGQRLDPTAAERRGRDGRLEILGIESVDPRLLREVIGRLADSAFRLRAIGSIAASLCQVAAARFDGLISLRDCRAVDAAAGQLIVREAGGAVGFPAFERALDAPLDLPAHSPVVAARTPAGVVELEALCLPR